MHPLLLILSLIFSTSLSAATGGGLIADNTAGTIATLQDQTHVITGGTAQGGNLLHSFREFNVETGQTADFQAAADTQNIVSRVTGTNNSWIDGKIKSTTSNADLYLVNPNGIVMGKNASLDVNGAFHATTADYVTLADGQRIYAAADQGVTLTVAAPEAFGFLDTSVGKIQINGSQLQVADGQAISLIGGEIDITSGAKLQAAGGRIDLVGAASAGAVKPTPNGITNTTITKADISLADSTITVDNHANSQTIGTIRVQGADITANNSFLWADNNSAVNAAGHSVELSATKDIRFTGSRSQIAANVNNSGKGGSVSLDADNQIAFSGAQIFVNANDAGTDAGDAGNLTLNARDIHFTDAAQLGAVTDGAGNGGDITLNASGTVYFSDAITGINGYQPSGIFVFTNSAESNAGSGGKITIQASDIKFAAGADINATTYGTGQGGSVNLDATDQITFQQRAQARVDSVGINAFGIKAGANVGDAGNLKLTARRILFTDLAQLGANTYSAGKAGDITLSATDQVHFTNYSYIFSHTESTDDVAGTGGNINIRATDIKFTSGADVSAVTYGTGRGGSVNLDATNQITFQRARGRVDSVGIKAGANAGDAGNLKLTARRILFTDLAQLGANTKSAGKAGDITLTATDLVHFSGTAVINGSRTASSGIFANADSIEDYAGSGGYITISALEIQFVEGARISAFTSGPGQGGTISLQAGNQIQLGRDIVLMANTFGTGTAGDLQLQAPNLIATGATIISGSNSPDPGAGSAGNLRIITGETIELSGGSALTTESANAGGGGIHIETRDRLHLQDSKITTSVKGGSGQGGNIFIDPVFVILENSQIQANAHGGPGGNITLIADYLLRSGPTAIEASSALSTPGDIDVQAVVVDAGSLQVTATPDPLDATDWAQVPCHLRQGKISRLIMAGYDAYPTPVDDLLSSLPLRVLRSAEPLSVPTSAVHQASHNLLAATNSTTGCSWL